MHGRHVLPMLAGSAPDDARRGGVAAAAAIAGALGGCDAAHALPLVVPLMARIGDPLPGVRGAATAAFASAVALIPLAQAWLARHINCQVRRRTCQGCH